jgi:hypothetical protein
LFGLRFRFMAFNATLNNILVTWWQSVLMVEDTGVLRENHWQTSSHNFVSSTPRLSGFKLTMLVVIGTDCIGSCKSNYHDHDGPYICDIYITNIPISSVLLPLLIGCGSEVCVILGKLTIQYLVINTLLLYLCLLFYLNFHC